MCSIRNPFPLDPMLLCEDPLSICSIIPSIVPLDLVVYPALHTRPTLRS